MQPRLTTASNLLSLSRIPLAAAFLLVFDMKSRERVFIGAAILGVAAITDYVDGRLARARNQTSRVGYLMDGIGDKVLYVAILLVVARERPNQELLAWALISREIVLYALRAMEFPELRELGRHRNLSLAYAWFIRAYFLVFMIEAIVPEDRTFYAIAEIMFALLAAGSGYLQLLLNFRLLAKSL